MSIVKIDYLGFSPGEWRWPLYRWTFSNRENEYSIVCRHAQRYFERILKIALSKDDSNEDAQEAAKHQVNQHVTIEDEIDHIGIDFFSDDGKLRVVGWSAESGEKALFELQCNRAEFIHDIAKLVDSHFQKIGILYYDNFCSGAFSINRSAEGFGNFEKQEFWLTGALSLSDIVLLKACVLGGYDTDKMFDDLDVNLSRDIEILTTPIV